MNSIRFIICRQNIFSADEIESSFVRDSWIGVFLQEEHKWILSKTRNVRERGEFAQVEIFFFFSFRNQSLNNQHELTR